MIHRERHLLAVVLAMCSAAACGSAAGPPSLQPVAVGSPSATASAATRPTPAPTAPMGVLTIHPVDPANGVPLGYISFVPAGVASAPRPLLLFLHGSGQSGPGTQFSLFQLYNAGIPELIYNEQGVATGWPTERPFIVLMPQHDATEATPCFTSAEIDGFLRRAIKDYPVDPKRIYITGLSCGAIGLWDYLGDHTNELVAAVVPIAGDAHDAFAKAGCKLGLVPIWSFHGLLDQNVDPIEDQAAMKALKACTKPKPVDARFTLFLDADHNVWDRTYTLADGNDVYAWMLGYTHP